MGWTIYIGKLAGINIRLHGMFIILLAAIAFSVLIKSGPLAAVTSVGLVGTVFGLVLLHEVGHSLMARRHGVRVHDITLWPLGGIARLAEIPEDPATEIKISLAGPAVNFGIALLLLGLLALTSLESVPISLSTINVLSFFLTVNLMMGAFNLLPAFPMDGGRILRAMLARRRAYVTATEIAARVGRWVAIVMGIAGLLLPNPWLVLIALFIYVAGGSEARQVRMRHAFPEGAAGGPPSFIFRPVPRNPQPHRPASTQEPPAKAELAEEFRRLAEDLDRITYGDKGR